MINIDRRLEIEIAPFSSRMSYDSAILYCFALNIDGKIGWRMPTWVEYHESCMILGWYVGRALLDCNHYVTPVRDLKDD